MQTIKDIRNKFAELYKNQDFIVDKNGGKVIELIGESFLCDEDFIFGKPNEDYIKREIEWYESQSLNVNDIPGGPPKIWQQVADKDGNINSNYGWMIFSEENGYQYKNVLDELCIHPNSRRATMIYQRPSMWKEYNKNGMSDFCCTFATQHFIRNSELITYVIMRSNDAWAGFRNDLAWHRYVSNNLFQDINNEKYENENKKEFLKTIKIIWTSGSLHLYDRQFYLVEHYIKTNEPYK